MGTTVAVLGAGGTMGLPMTRNLARSGLEVRAWNRSRAKADPLVQDGVGVFDSAAAATSGADVLLTILSDADAVVNSLEPALGAFEGDVIWLQMSTIGEEGTERCMELAQARGVTFVDAPVLGTKQPAEQGKLVILASGPESVRDRLEPIFAAIGQRTMWVGPAGDGTRLKLVVNTWVLTVVEGGAETIALAEGLGLDPALFFEAIDGGGLDLPYLRMKGTAMLERNFEPSFKLELAAKDARLAEEAAERRALDLPLLSAIRRRLADGVPDHGEEDMSATYLTSAGG
jgi:3-hydroxyisobutyrate dehydrogenase